MYVLLAHRWHIGHENTHDLARPAGLFNSRRIFFQRQISVLLCCQKMAVLFGEGVQSQQAQRTDVAKVLLPHALCQVEGQDPSSTTWK